MHMVKNLSASLLHSFLENTHEFSTKIRDQGHSIASYSRKKMGPNQVEQPFVTFGLSKRREPVNQETNWEFPKSSLSLAWSSSLVEISPLFPRKNWLPREEDIWARKCDKRQSWAKIWKLLSSISEPSSMINVLIPPLLLLLLFPSTFVCLGMNIFRASVRTFPESNFKAYAL